MKNIRIFVAVMTLALVASWSAQAQTLTTLFNFCNDTNSCPDGSDPGGLIKGTDGNFYGTTSAGGTNDFGTIFKITPQGTLTTLFLFTNVFDTSAALSLESGGLIYGTTFAGGTNHHGTVFTITPSGTLTTIHQFNGTDGQAPVHLVQGTSATTFIGTTAIGGTNNAGTVFQITSAGTVTTLHQFSGTNTVVNDGTGPVIFLVSGSTFIGTTEQGGTNNDGTAFSITAGGSFTLLHEFANNVDGSEPILTAKNGANFIGTTVLGGSNNVGTAFQMTPAGTVTTFYQFSGTNGVKDGTSPGLSPVQNNAGAFFGASQDGGTNGQGLVFTLSTSGVLTPVYEFCSVGACLDGSSPGSFAQGDDGNAYGTTDAGGANDGGTFFKLDITAGGGGGGGGCTLAVNPTTVTLTDKGGKKSIAVKATGTGCSWTAVSNDPFITIISGTNGTSSGKVEIIVGDNTNTTALSGTLTIAGQTVTINQAVGGCTFKLSPKAAKLKSTGGVKTVKVNPNFTNCTWTAFTTNSFITITGGASGTGKGVVTFSVSTNSTTNVLSGTMTIAGQTYTVTQTGVKPPKD